MIKESVFNEKTGVFTLQTQRTAYAFQIVHGKYVVHLYYGEKGRGIKEYSARRLAFASYTENDGENFYFETTPSEYPFFGSGDFGVDALRIRNKNGNNVTYFEYDGYEIFAGREKIKGLPYAEAKESDYTVCIRYKDALNNLVLNTYYTVFYDCDVISRYAVLKNDGDESVFIENAKSLVVDFPCGNYDVISLYGSHYDERTLQRINLPVGKCVFASDRGTSSHHINPFFALCEWGTEQTQGDVYGFNFVYSGSFENVLEKNRNRVRVAVGINGAVEGHLLKTNQTYYSPEAVMTFSKDGIGGMSRNFHAFIKGHIIPEKHLKSHPLVLNTWEAFYFDIDEDKLLELAREAVKVGIDTLVVDDGWFSSRNDETAGLGDWWVNTDKFPSGLQGFSEKIEGIGLHLGIWIEPEMVNPNSELYRKHPEWCLNAYGRPLALSRNQLVLNLALEEVREYLKETFKKTFYSVRFHYIKWDMNRSLSMVAGNYAGADDNNIYRRFMEGVYDLHQWFNDTYPSVMIEGCSGGGGRYDLGMMKYVNQIWTSDNTYPADRARIQNGSLIAYPACVMSCHVSNPENVLTSVEEAEYRFKVASAGVLGYEMDILSVSDEIKNTIKKQIEEYAQFKNIVLYGEYYPLFAKDEVYIFYYYHKQTQSLALFYTAKQPKGESKTVKITAVNEDGAYQFVGAKKVYSGKELKEGIELVLEKKADVLHFVQVNKNE